jgi:hypothetical protein
MPLFLHKHLQRTVDPPPVKSSDRRAWTELGRVVDQAIGLQRIAEGLLEALGREPHADLARRGGPIMSGFVALRRELPRSDNGVVRRYVDIVDSVLEHHAELLSALLEELSIGGHADHEAPVGGLGPHARWLERVQVALAGEEELAVD